MENYNFAYIYICMLQAGEGCDYLVQWKDFQYDASTRQPETSLNADVIGEYDNPIVTAEQIANEVTVLSSAFCGFLWHRGVVVHPTSVRREKSAFRDLQP